MLEISIDLDSMFVDISVGGYKFYTFFIWVSREISLLRHIMIH